MGGPWTDCTSQMCSARDWSYRLHWKSVRRQKHLRGGLSNISSWKQVLIGESKLMGEHWITDTVVFTHWGVRGRHQRMRSQKWVWLIGCQAWTILVRLDRCHFSILDSVKALCYQNGKMFLRTWTREFVGDQT